MISSLEEWILELRASNKLILVEGQNDKKALEELGITNVMTVSKTPIYKTVEKIREQEVIIFTDLDKEGKKFYSTLRHHLQKRGVKIDRVFREFLLKETKVTTIEGLPHYLRTTVATASKIGTDVLKL
jgi:5S rRNA maturation endonuclease (ribonuclease M5)